MPLEQLQHWKLPQQQLPQAAPPWLSATPCQACACILDLQNFHFCWTCCPVPVWATSPDLHVGKDLQVFFGKFEAPEYSLVPIIDQTCVASQAAQLSAGCTKLHLMTFLLGLDQRLLLSSYSKILSESFMSTPSFKISIPGMSALAASSASVAKANILSISVGQPQRSRS